MGRRKEELTQMLEQKQGRHLGDLCGWSLQGPFIQDRVRQLAEEHGIDGDLGLPKLSPISAYRRAVTASVKGGRNDEKKYEAICVEDNTVQIVHSLVRRDIVDGESTLSKKDASFDTECKIGFDKGAYKDGASSMELVKYEKPDHPLAKRVAAEYEALCGQFVAGDIRIAFQRAFLSWGGIGLLSHGGLWWVPSPSAEKVRAWKGFMLDLNNSTVIIPVFDTEETINSLIQQSKETLEARLQTMLDQLSDFAKRGGTRVSTLEKRIEMFDDLRANIDLHVRVLGAKQDELLLRLDAAQKGLVNSLAGITD